MKYPKANTCYYKIKVEYTIHPGGYCASIGNARAYAQTPEHSMLALMKMICKKKEEGSLVNSMIIE